MDNYKKCLETMYGLRRFGIKLGLGTIKKILNGLGNPQQNFRSIHVAGTNGKGSVASTLAAILKAAGYRVGLYTSPHLMRFNERIRINGRPIFNKDVIGAYEAVKGAHSGKREPTFFEFATELERCQDSQYPLELRLQRLGRSLTRLDSMVSLDKELLAWAAAARWLSRVHAFGLASLAASEYMALMFRLTLGDCQDTLGIIEDLLKKAWLKGNSRLPEAG